MNKLLLTLMVLLLSGCGGNEEAQALYNNPEVSEVVTVEGCQVKFVNRGYANQSFYIATCGDTTTLTRNWTEKHGKTSVVKRSTTITQQIQDLEKQRTNELAKETAISKLTPEELAALQVK